MVAMLWLTTAAIKQPDEINRRTPTYFTRRLKSAATASLFNQSVEEHIHNFRRSSKPNLNWDAVKEMYRTAGDLEIGKPPRRRKPWMSASTWALIEMRNDLKKDIEATHVCSRSALESEYKTKSREVKRSRLPSPRSQWKHIVYK